VRDHARRGRSLHRAHPINIDCYRSREKRFGEGEPIRSNSPRAFSDRKGVSLQAMCKSKVARARVLSSRNPVEILSPSRLSFLLAYTGVTASFSSLTRANAVP